MPKFWGLKPIETLKTFPLCSVLTYTSGLPSVGKTFTVKATSEYFKLPLFSISVGELVVDHGDSNTFK
ncbi:hypothetical protein NUU61_001947 [Penicillium alfredii]|uniref:ATPase AAA-type core domain-containing protein n=1 Tax=Penicillium alfredii TaxID=1506179 RepID=A0A9W9FR99_9EURO|nr:uncharacterized protein NUU61_001947 [Penicillium alfredii]KAJ5104600.1 hypothetical protein NUU61_001947 [Penicillium alfredii]